MKKKPTHHVQLKVVTWDKQSHGLFDYQSKSLKQKHYQVDTSCVILQNPQDSELELSSESSAKSLLIKHHYQALGTIEVNFDNFSFKNYTANQSNDAYLVVRSLKNTEGQQKGFSLALGDNIRFGRLKYTVLQYRDDKNTHTGGHLALNLETHFSEESLHGTCKICLSEEQQPDNFLISPCCCKGSCQFVHLLCLKQWIQSKVCKETHGIVQLYNFTKFQCQICKIPFPEKVIRGEKCYDMLVINKPSQPYLLLQSISENKQSKNVYLIRVKKEQSKIKLGRGHQCDIRMSDISVSRVHAQIQYKNNSFVIFDNSSKFGTLVQLRHSLPLTHQRCAIQIGRTVIICVCKPNSTSTLRGQAIKKVHKEYNTIAEFGLHIISK